MSAHLTFGRYLRLLGGDRAAIRDAMMSRPALGLGAVLVLSAGFARNWDAQLEATALLMRLAAPFVASLGTSALIYVLIWMLLRAPGFMRGYVAFLTVYWLTAPMAWLYGMPVELAFGADWAAAANVAALVMVSVWRIVLMARAGAVLAGTNQGVLTAILIGCEIVIFAAAFRDGLGFEIESALRATTSAVLKGVNFMSGNRFGPGAAVAFQIASLVTMVAFLALPVCVLLWLHFLWQPRAAAFPRPYFDGGIDRRMWWFAWGSVCFWGALMAWFQWGR